MSGGKINAEVIERICGALRVGADLTLASSIGGVSRYGLRKYLVKHPDAAEKVQEARDRADEIIVKRLFDKARDGDTIAMIFWLKNRRPDDWRDRRVLAGDPKAPLLTGPLHLVIDGETDADAAED